MAWETRVSRPLSFPNHGFEKRRNSQKDPVIHDYLGDAERKLAYCWDLHCFHHSMIDIVAGYWLVDCCSMVVSGIVEVGLDCHCIAVAAVYFH